MQETLFQREKVATYQDMRIYLVTLSESQGGNAYPAVLKGLDIGRKGLPTMKEMDIMSYSPQGVYLRIGGPRIASSKQL